MKFFALILLAFVAFTQAQSDPNYCYSTDTIKPQRAMFSSKTAYEVIRGRSINPNVSSECEMGSKLIFILTIYNLNPFKVVRHLNFGCYSDMELVCRMAIK
jgi:hypothetical protein